MTKWYQRAFIILLFHCAIIPVYAGTKRHRPHSISIKVGWHDEFNTLEGWSPWTASGGGDILSGMDGTLRVSLGKTAMFMKDFKDYRAGVWKEFDIDLRRYPILVVRTSRFRKGSSWDVEVMAFREKKSANAHDIINGGGIPTPGNTDQLAADRVINSGPRRKPDILFLKVEPNDNIKRQGKRHVRLNLNLSGPKLGAAIDFVWVRFLTEDAAKKLRSNPHFQHVHIIEPKERYEK